MGGGGCDMHPDMGLTCNEYHALWRGTNHWRGLHFKSSEYEEKYFQENTLYQKMSKSSLEYVDISYAGLGPQRETTSGIMTWGVPPKMSYISVTKSAYNGINVTLPGTFFRLDNAVIAENAGYGVYANTSSGLVSIEDNCIIRDNQADGIKYNFHHAQPDRSASLSFQDFCTGSSNPNVAYPITTIARQERLAYNAKDCKRKFYIPKHGYVFTIHFTYMQADVGANGILEVRDWDQNGKVLSKFDIQNGTFPPSVVSRTNQIWVRFQSRARKLAFVYMEVTANIEKIYDISVKNSFVSKNNGHGVSVENMRSLVQIHQSNLTENFFGSGLNVKQGAGDVNVTYSTVSNNIGDGVNITYEGGLQNVSWSHIENNKLRGVAVWFNESGQDTHNRQETGVAYTVINGNLDVGVLVGNFCREAFVNISSNSFTDSQSAALEVQSCWLQNKDIRTVQIGQNLFVENKRIAVQISPAVNMNLTIEYNEFHRNKLGTIMLYNEDKVELQPLPFIGKIVENNFYDNTGLFVLRLSLSILGLDQSLFINHNTIKRNIIKEPYDSMLSRSRTSGVICVGSANVLIYRNLLDNPDSIYEISSHALDQSTPVNASYNWMGSKNELTIFNRVLDRRDRYNLALIIFHPYLLHDTNPDTSVIFDQQMSEPPFFNPNNNREIGGEVSGQTYLTDGVYSVKSDIFVRDSGTLTIAFGTTLEFSEGVGMMIAGKLNTEGTETSKVRFTLAGTTFREAQLRTAALMEEELRALPLNETNGALNDTIEEPHLEALNMTSGPDMTVKLVGGRDQLEGRLMVYIDGTWGSVCNHGWTEDSAAIACQQMGYVLNPDDWDLEPGNIPADGSDSRILMSNVHCDEFDIDLTSCESDREWELENSCKHMEDVGLRCYPRSWAGMRLGMTARESSIKSVIIEKAGLLDYTARSFRPALQIDFHHHVIQDIQVSDNALDGVGVIYSDQYAIRTAEARHFRGCTFTNNKRHGISVRQLGVNISDSQLYQNGGSGFHFNPFLHRSEQRELTGWLKLKQDEYLHIPSDGNSLHLTDNERRFLISDTIRGSGESGVITVTTLQKNVIGIQILNPIQPSSTENILIHDFDRITNNKDTKRWDVRSDLVVFPTTSSSYSITIQYESGPYALGDVIIVLTSISRRDIAQAGDLQNFRGKWPMVFMRNTKIHNNDIGISTLHYNRYLTDDGDHLLRCSNESIHLVQSEVVDNTNQAIFSLSPFRVSMDNDDIGEITFMINSSLIARNGRGIDQYNWDIRESNNLFNWVFENAVIENQKSGGLVLELPYVWQYTENFTHTVYINSSTFNQNSRFEFSVDGHFARINITYSKFTQNVCKKGLFSIKGMEKEMFIYENSFTSNTGSFMVEFDTDSQSEIRGIVSAYFEYNTVQNNNHALQTRSSLSRAYTPASYVIGVRGLQKLNITRNLLGYNEMDYELLAGLFTSRIDNYINVETNWWGSKDPDVIAERIFDFDDWNNYALADYLPYLIDNNINAPVSSVAKRITYTQMDLDSLGGRLTEDLRLPARDKPYIVKSDLTVMPGIQLVIDPGVVLEFFPSVGLLVLGRMDAIGRKDQKIVMRPVNTDTETHYRVGRQARSPPSSVRLCIEGDCENKSDGFLEIFNGTSQQWVPICDDRFTERNAEIVCHQLGYNKVNIFYGWNKRTEMFPNALIRVRAWPEPIQCSGTEDSLDQCPIRMNGQIFDHHYDCPWNGNFVYISCGNLNLEEKNQEYWGGVRFSIAHFEHMGLYNRLQSSHNHLHSHPPFDGQFEDIGWDNIYDGTQQTYPSLLEHVEIIGAGILHNDKSPALMSFYETPFLRNVVIKQSASDGLSLVAASNAFDMLYNRFENNLGYGVSIIGLTGETRETDESSFFPLGKLCLPYHMFGMIDICDSAKELKIEERVLLYYKYDNRPVDCVKIFSSVFNVKNFGFRLLQFNLFNSTTDPSVPDRIVLYDGDIYNYTHTEILTEIHMNSSNSMKFFKTDGTSLSVQLHATGASGLLGFVAEVVTLPISDLGINRDVLQNLTYNEYYDNQEGAVFAATAGEVNPWLCLSWSRIERNGRKMYGNFTTTRAAVHMDLQNMQDIYFKNNLVRNNTGGLYVLTGSMGAATKLQANITNNLFQGTKHWPSLYIASRENSAYQHALIAHNDFSWANSPYHDVITLAQVVSVFANNYVHSNLGRHILDIYGFQKVRLPVYQTTSHNHFTKNIAVDPTYQGTVVAGSAGQQFVDNVFYNWDNAYELVAVNESVSGLRRSDVWKTPIDARDNWWGFNNTAAVAGRIHDKTDDETLLAVDFSSWKLNNETLLHGCEPGYTLIGKACYLYVGAPVQYHEAKAFCKKDNASLPFLQRYYVDVTEWVSKQQPEYHWQYDMIWVQHLDVVRGCAAFINRQVRSIDCSLNLPFICESDPDVTIDKFAWASDTLALAAIISIIGVILLVIACLSCWFCKSRHRRKERMVRRNSIRASIRSNRSVISTTSGGFSSDGRRRIIQNSSRGGPAIRGGMGASNGAVTPRSNGVNGSFDSISKSHFNASIDEDPDPSFVVYEDSERSPPCYTTDVDQRFAQIPDLENANVNAMVHPSFDITFENHGFRDNSTMGGPTRDNSTFFSQAHLQDQWDAAANNDIRHSSYNTPTFSTYGHNNSRPNNHNHVNRRRPPSNFTGSQAEVIRKRLYIQIHLYEAIPQDVYGFNRPWSMHCPTSSFKNMAMQDANQQLGMQQPPADSIAEMKQEMERARQLDYARGGAPALLRDQRVPVHAASTDILSDRNSPSCDSQNLYSQGRSQSQPLETAM
ncbi:unnamed protein product, partial [Meganyctiphanes norvegica]